MRDCATNAYGHRTARPWTIFGRTGLRRCTYCQPGPHFDRLRAIECLYVLAMITGSVLIGRSPVLAPVEHESTGMRVERVAPLN